MADPLLPTPPPQGLELLPADDEGIEPDAALDAATAGALEDPFDAEEALEPVPLPFGLTWYFDWETERMVRSGTAPAPARGFSALAIWCLTMIHTAAGSCPLLDEELGMEYPTDVIGYAGADVGEIEADWEDRLRAALTRHDRITDVSPLRVEYDPDDGTVTVSGLDGGPWEVITDEEEPVRLDGVTLDAVPLRDR